MRSISRAEVEGQESLEVLLGSCFFFSQSSFIFYVDNAKAPDNIGEE